VKWPNWKRVAVFLLLSLLPITACLFFFPCTRLGPPAPPPFFEHVASNGPIAFSPDSKWLAFTQDKRVLLCRLADHPAVEELTEVPESTIMSLAFSGDSTRLIVGSGALSEYDIATRKLIRNIEIRDHAISNFWLCPHSEKIVATLSKKTTNYTTSLESFDLNNPEHRTRLHPNLNQISDVKFSKDGQFVAAADGGNLIYVWNTTDWSVHRQIPSRPYGKLALHWSAPTIAVAEGEDHRSSVHIWSMAEVKHLARWKTQGNLRGLEYHKDGDLITLNQHYFFTLPQGCSLGVWDVQGRRKSWLGVHNSFAYHLALSNDGEFVATLGNDGPTGWRVKVWRWEHLVSAR